MDKSISFKSKMWNWINFTINCFKTKNPFIKQAWMLTNISNKVVELADKSKRKDVLEKQTATFMPEIFGIYFTVTSFHSTIQTLALSGYGQNAWLIVRPQLESLLIFLYVIESHDDFTEIEKRLSKYNDWLTVKKYFNEKSSSKFPFTTKLSSHKEYEISVKQNYNSLKKKYNDIDLKKLRKSSSFLQNKPDIARRHNIDDLYYHIQSESSASLHIADIPDRMKIEKSGSLLCCTYNENIGDADWVMMLSNLLQLNLINKFSNFLDLQDTVKPLLKKIV